MFICIYIYIWRRDINPLLWVIGAQPGVRRKKIGMEASQKHTQIHFGPFLGPANSMDMDHMSLYDPTSPLPSL